MVSLIVTFGLPLPLALAQERVPHRATGSSLPLYAIRGHVYLEGTHEPLEGFDTYLCQRWTVLGEAKTDGNGFFQFGLIRMPPSKLRLMVRPPLEIYQVPAKTFRLGGQGGDVDVTLYARCVFDATYVRNLTWEGRVFQWDGVSPLEGIEVALRREEFSIGRTRTDGRGFFKFVFHDLPPGPYALTVATANDLLQGATSSLQLGQQDIFKRESIVLESPNQVQLRRLTILGRARPTRGVSWGLVGAKVRFATGPYVIGTSAVGEKGYFHAEKVHAPPGPLLIEVLPNLGLLRPGQTMLVVPQLDSPVSTARVEVSVRPTARWWAMMLLLPTAGGVCLWAVLRFWVLPEWRNVRKGMVSCFPRSAGSATSPGERPEKQVGH